MMYFYYSKFSRDIGHGKKTYISNLMGKAYKTIYNLKPSKNIKKWAYLFYSDYYAMMPNPKEKSTNYLQMLNCAVYFKFNLNSIT